VKKKFRLRFNGTVQNEQGNKEKKRRKKKSLTTQTSIALFRS